MTYDHAGIRTAITAHQPETIETTPSAPNAGLAVDAHGLVKSFGTTRAVDGIDLVVREGEILGVLGPNGAGKTTMLQMLATLLRSTVGAPGSSAMTFVASRTSATADRRDRPVRLGG